MEKIIIAFEKEKNALYIREMVENAALAAVQVCRSGAEIRRLAGQESVAVVVCGFKLADGSAEALFEDLPPGVSMLMIAPRPQLDLCGSEGIFKLAAPVHRSDLLSSIHMLLQMSRRLERAAPGEKRRRAEEEGCLRQAKAVLMTRHGMSEEEAHRFLQKQSMDRGCKLTEMARLVLEERD